MKKLMIAVIAAVASMQAVAADQAIVDIYNKTCVACHASGAVGAPKTGNAEEWAPRMEKGMDALVQSANAGLNAMPPKGMCFDCTDDQFKALIEYMATAQ